jgi:hypothetical protein
VRREQWLIDVSPCSRYFIIQFLAVHIVDDLLLLLIVLHLLIVDHLLGVEALLKIVLVLLPPDPVVVGRTI